MHYIAGRKGESEMAQVKTVSGKKETWKEKCARTAREVVKRHNLGLGVPTTLDELDELKEIHGKQVEDYQKYLEEYNK